MISQSSILESLEKGKIYVSQEELCWFWWAARHYPLDKIEVLYNPNFKEVVVLTTYDDPSGEDKLLLVCYSSNYVGRVKFTDYKPSPSWTVVVSLPSVKSATVTGGNFVELKLLNKSWYEEKEVQQGLQRLTKSDRDRFLVDFKDEPTRGIVQLRKSNPMDYSEFKEEEYLKDIIIRFLEDYRELKALTEKPKHRLYAWYYTSQLENCTLCNVLTSYKYVQKAQNREGTGNAGLCRDLWCYYETLVTNKRSLFRTEPGLGAKLFFTWVSLASTQWADKSSPGIQINKKVIKGKLYHFIRFSPSEMALNQFRKLLR